MRQPDGITEAKLRDLAPREQFPPLLNVLEEDRDTLVVPKSQRVTSQMDGETTAGEYSRTVISS